MLSPKTQYNLANAQNYFAEHLCVGDYYSERALLRGEWIGRGAAQLGLSGYVREAEFLALCENREPQTGERLTQRHKTTRREGDAEVANRRVFYDFTLSPPKSVSVAALVGNDPGILAAHAEAVKLAIGELERFAAVQVHIGRQRLDRTTGNIIAALFQHDTSRALDPHLHTHCIVFNATHDTAEGRWKALHNHAMLTAQKYVENVYYHRLAQSLREAGYTVVNHARGDFELAEVPQNVRACFSKRHREVDERTRAFLAERNDAPIGNVADLREHIAHKHRAQKSPAVPLSELREFWLSQLTDADRQTLGGNSGATETQAFATTAAQAVDWAEAHLFERRSVVHEHELWRHALAAGRGGAFTLKELKAETQSRQYLRCDGDQLSRADVLTREWNLVELARCGVGRHQPFTGANLWQRDDLAPDQQRAFAQILSSRDFVTLFRGGAGTGKSHVLQRIQMTLHAAGKSTVVLAPQRQQVLDLERDGLSNTQTVSELLQRGALPTGSVLIVDEAGQIGGCQLLALLTLAQRSHSRVILSGDTRQHGPVEASDALRAIERYAELRFAELNEIRRQDPQRARTPNERTAIANYRAAVKAAAVGDFVVSFQTLEKMGAITECTTGEQASALIAAYLRIVATGESALIVTQTRSEVRDLNEAIRAAVRGSGNLGAQEQLITTLEAVDLTNAEKTDLRFYPADAVAILRRSKGGNLQGNVRAVTRTGVVLEVDGKLRSIRRNDLDRLTVLRPQSLAISPGDRLQLKANAATASGSKLANGEIVTVSAVQPDGTLALDDGRRIPPTYRQFVRGYAVTSYGSQGKTVEHVLFSDSATRAATTAEQWYVTISRARKSIHIFTPDKLQLAAAISRAGHRSLALDFFPQVSPVQTLRRLLAARIQKGRALARKICLSIAALRHRLQRRQTRSHGSPSARPSI